MHPIELDATLKLAKTKLRTGRVAEAEAMYRQVLMEQPECAEAIHFLGLAAMTRGKLDEALTLVRRSVELDASKCEYHNNLATVLGHKNLAIEALGSAQRAIEIKDDFPEAHGNKGVALEKLGRLDEAIDSYRQAIELREDYVEGLLNLGNALSRKAGHDEAIARLKRAAELASTGSAQGRLRDGNLRKNLGNAQRRAGRPEQAVTAYRMAVELNPKDADAYNNLGAALQESGKVREAADVLRTCLSINPNHTDAHWNLGLALLALGDWRQGWIEYEWRRHLREDLGQKRGFPQPAWNGSPIEGRTVLVMCEQGLGDTIQFIRYVPLLAARGAKVIVECQSKLRPLLMGLKDTIGGGCGTADASGWKVIARGEPLPNFDVHARLMTLPGIFGSTPQDVPNGVPYLSVEEERVERWRGELGEEEARRHGGTQARREGREEGEKEEARRHGGTEARTEGRGEGEEEARRQEGMEARREGRGLRVGVVWQGSTAHKGDRFRSIPLEMFGPLAQVPGVQLVSLQKGYGSEQIERVREGMQILEWGDPADTTAEALLDTAAVMKCMDLVVTVDTSMCHMAGALGVPVWVAMPLASDWRWLVDREDSPWYPTMRLFRQKRLGDWESVIRRMAEALREMGINAADMQAGGEHVIEEQPVLA